MPMPTTISELQALCFTLSTMYIISEDWRERKRLKREHNEAARLLIKENPTCNVRMIP